MEEKALDIYQEAHAAPYWTIVNKLTNIGIQAKKAKKLAKNQKKEIFLWRGIKIPFFKEKIKKIHYKEKDILQTGSSTLKSLIKNKKRPLVIICIGTDRSTGDSLGPLVGMLLKKMGVNHVYGDIYSPIHAVNIETAVASINEYYENPYIIAIDACLGREGSVGLICMSNKPIKPGLGVDKDLPPVGDVSITGIVNIGGFMEFFVLQNTRLAIVYKIAETIAEIVHSSISHIEDNGQESLTLDDLLAKSFEKGAVS